MKLEISDWKTVPYAEAWDRQTACFDALVHAKQAGEEYVNRIVLCEHPHVYTWDAAVRKPICCWAKSSCVP